MNISLKKYSTLADLMLTQNPSILTGDHSILAWYKSRKKQLKLRAKELGVNSNYNKEIYQKQVKLCQDQVNSNQDKVN